MIASCIRRVVVRACTLLFGLSALSDVAAAQGDPADLARRIADVVAIAVDEYGLGVVAGRVVSEDELREAQLFLEEARRTAAHLPSEAREEVGAVLDELVIDVTALRPRTRLERKREVLRELLERTLAVALDPLPTNPPSVVRGATLYAQHCQRCHGDVGAGDGLLGQGLDPPPADLTDRGLLRGSSPLEFFRKINVGVAGTGMPGFGETLGLNDRWALALYASLLRFSADERQSGAEPMERLCPECLLVVSDFDQTARVTDDSLAALLAVQGPSVTDSVLPNMVAYARAAGAIEELGADRGLAVARIVSRAKDEIGNAIALAREGNSEGAAASVVDAYLLFEQIESALRARDGGSAREVERSFTELRGALLAGGAWSGVIAARDRVLASLDRAADRLAVSASVGALFSQSLVIILREGLEAILIVGALGAFLVQAGASERRRDLAWGVLAALGASGITALGFATMMRNAARHREVLEGITMVAAAGVLFWVSYWLVSKIELKKWQAFVSSQMRRALTGGRVLALPAVAFLAVYREGFETVLFYAALFTSSNGGLHDATVIVSGMVSGLAVLVAVYLGMQRYGIRLPLKPFFAITSALLYLMAFSFAGQGVATLQGAGVVPVTPLNWIPSIPLLGIFPTAQTLTTQLFVATALLGALVWVFWLQPRSVQVRSS